MVFLTYSNDLDFFCSFRVLAGVCDGLVLEVRRTFEPAMCEVVNAAMHVSKHLGTAG